MPVIEIYTPRNHIQIYNDMEGYVVGKAVGLTNFNVGSRVRTILEGVSLVSGQTHYDFYQALLKAIPVALYEGLKFTRKGGLKASGQVRISVDDPVVGDTPVPIGLTISVNGFDYATTTAGIILDGNTDSDLITIQSVNEGENKNLFIGDIDIRSGFGSFVGNSDFDHAYNPVVISGGTDEESDEERKERFFETINGLTRTTPPGILGAMLKVEGVKSAYLLEWFPSNGWNTIYIDDGSGTIPQALRDELNKVINGDISDPVNYPGYRAAGIRTDFQPPTRKIIEITYEIDIDEETQDDPDDIVDLVTNAIQIYVNNLKLRKDFVLTEVHTAGQKAHVDVVDIRVTAMTVDTVPLVPVGNVPIALNEVAKNFVTNGSYNLIEY